MAATRLRQRHRVGQRDADLELGLRGAWLLSKLLRGSHRTQLIEEDNLMPRGEKDHGTNWLTQHHAAAIARLLGVTGFRACRPAHPRITLPQTIPDGLLEVELPASTKPLPLLVEWEAYPARETEQQLVRDTDLAEMSLGVLPDTVVIVLSPRGRGQARQRVQQSALGWSQRRHRWRVLRLWTVPAAELLALNEVGLTPLLPLTRTRQKPEVLLEQCRERIERQARPEERPSLLTITAIFATMRFARAEEWLNLLGGKPMLSQSPLYQQWMAEKECETNQEAIISVLTARLGEMPEDLAAQIRTITDAERLRRGIVDAAVCTSLKDFRKRLARE